MDGVGTADFKTRAEEIFRVVSSGKPYSLDSLVKMYHLEEIDFIDLCGHCEYEEPSYVILAHVFFHKEQFSEKNVDECRLVLLAVICEKMKAEVSEGDIMKLAGTVNINRRMLTLYLPDAWTEDDIECFNKQIEKFGWNYGKPTIRMPNPLGN